MSKFFYISHPEVVIDPATPVPQWHLSEVGRARAAVLSCREWMREVEAIYSSNERKARDLAEIIGATLSIEPRYLDGLCEIDRTSTGFLEANDHEATADAFFAHPYVSIRGWERAADAQARIATAIGSAIDETREARAVAVCGHGGVGALYLCKLKGVAISRGEQQRGMGNYYVFETPSARLLHGWRPIDG
jgi:broad specificity phosphatase PhoE